MVKTTEKTKDTKASKPKAAVKAAKPKARPKTVKKTGDFAVIKTGGKQYLVFEGDTIKIEKIKDAKEGGNIEFNEVLLVSKGSDLKIGTPLVDKAKVTAKNEGEVRGKKITVLRYKSKTRYTKKKGHRQPYSKIIITKIQG